ncbi:hypothetical protein GKQ38_00855 [Candidatus Nanohaloarchaea archaeon]|nr:hypothetical protein GKQ38_00855 [Candidatus Nanohaloarchaea archaeon]
MRRIYNKIGIKEKVPQEAKPAGRLEIAKNSKGTLALNRHYLPGRLHSEEDKFLLTFKHNTDRIGPEVTRMGLAMKNLKTLATALGADYGFSAGVAKKGLKKLNQSSKNYNKKILSPLMPGENKWRYRKR